MEVIQKTNVPFMKYRFICGGISLALILFSVVTWVQKGNAKFGVDFLGGIDVVVRFSGEVNSGDIRKALNKAGFKGAVVQEVWETDVAKADYSIRLKEGQASSTSEQIIETLKTLDAGKIEIRKDDFVGPVIGEQIRNDGIKSMVIALFCILVYISVRFEWRFAVGAIVALVHDITITTGVFLFSGREISAAVLAALLTIIGYSLNDTIIVFDRVRENFNRALSGKKSKDGVNKTTPFIELVNISINQTLSRTILTSLTTLFVCISLWLFGGGAIADLSFALVIGVVVGTYSSIFIACVAVVALDRDFGKESNRQLQKAA